MSPETQIEEEKGGATASPGPTAQGGGWGGRVDLCTQQRLGPHLRKPPLPNLPYTPG